MIALYQWDPSESSLRNSPLRNKYLVTFVPKETRLYPNPISFLSIMLHEYLAGVSDENLNDADAWLWGLNRGLQKPTQEEEEQPFLEYKE